MRLRRVPTPTFPTRSRRACITRLVAGAGIVMHRGHTESLVDEAAIRRMIRDASRALQAGNAPLFLSLIDRQFFGEFATFREDLSALTTQRRIASSVESGTPLGGPEEWKVRIDWLLDLTHRVDPGPVERRRTAVTVTVRRRSGKWRIVRIEPRSFFAPLPRPSR